MIIERKQCVTFAWNFFWRDTKKGQVKQQVTKWIVAQFHRNLSNDPRILALNLNSLGDIFQRILIEHSQFEKNYKVHELIISIDVIPFEAWGTRLAWQLKHLRNTRGRQKPIVRWYSTCIGSGRVLSYIKTKVWFRSDEEADKYCGLSGLSFLVESHRIKTSDYWSR